MSNNVVPLPLQDLLQEFKREIFKDLRVCLPANITAVNANGTVDVLPSTMQNIYQAYLANGIDFPYPQITGCPIFTIQGGGIGTIMPVEVGDECMVIFCDNALDNWITTGTPQPLPSFRRHDYSDAFVLVGLNSFANPIDSPLLPNEGGICETQNPSGAKIAINNSTSKVTMANGTQNLSLILGLLTTYLTTLNGLLSAMTIASLTSGATQSSILALSSQIVTITSDLAALLY